jgi:uncharacterized membrane protein
LFGKRGGRRFVRRRSPRAWDGHDRPPHFRVGVIECHFLLVDSYAEPPRYTLEAFSPAAGPGYNFVYGANESGILVGTSDRQAHARIDGRLHALTVSDGVFSGAARDVNEQGVIVGAYGEFDESGPRHCLWPSANAPPILLRGVSRNNASGSAWAINKSGQIAGVSGGTEGVFCAVLWDRPRARPKRLGLLPGAFNSEGVAINNRGDVVGRSGGESSVEAFWYDDSRRSMGG